MSRIKVLFYVIIIDVIIFIIIHAAIISVADTPALLISVSGAPAPLTVAPHLVPPVNLLRPQVLSSSQGNIIAVANPALSMSAAMASTQMSDEERHISALYTLSQTVGAAAAARGNAIKQEPNSPGATKQE